MAILEIFVGTTMMVLSFILWPLLVSLLIMPIFPEDNLTIYMKVGIGIAGFVLNYLWLTFIINNLIKIKGEINDRTRT